jgi:protein TonB
MDLSSPPPAAAPRLNRTAVIVAGVVAFHVLAIWALQTGLLRRAVEVVVPIEMLSEMITPPAPQVEPAPQPAPVEPVKPPVIKKVERKPPAPPKPVAVPDTRPTPTSPNAPTGIVTPQEPAPPVAAPVAPAIASAPPAPPKIELPLSSADYLQNPRPAYPPLSRRLGEQGQVIVRVMVGADGVPQSAELRKSSGFERLDQAALATALKWRYVPGKRGGVPEAMPVNVPINFVLE